MAKLIKTRLPKIEVGAKLCDAKAGNVFRAKAADRTTTEIELYDEIGFWGVNAKDFRSTLQAISTPKINLRINSPGGDVFDGIAMYNDLVAHPAEVAVTVTGLAASAASVIAMAGDTVEVADNAFIMIHNAWSVVVGDSREMDKMAKTLARINKALADTYADRTGLDVAELVEMMNEETWLGAAEAVEAGFADSTTAAVDAKAAFDVSVFKNAPDAIVRDIKRSEPQKADSRSAALSQFLSSIRKGYSHE